ncbi:MAG: DUF6364 family protein [Bacteroidetes bacterium]|nr:hypothetical protein [Bacteroidota bacterium]MCA0446087.1 DUF6364 family protein [Bacteroidota bacterium]
MNTKLTLNLNQEIIEKAKIYARSKNRSISKIVEEYLRSLATEKSNSTVNTITLEPITRELLGMIKTKHDLNVDYDEILTDALLEKYK